MFKKLNDALLEAKEKLRTKLRLESLLSKARQSLAHEQTRLENLGVLLKKEEADVRKLEGLSLTGMFHQMLGSKEQKLSKERQEFLAAKLKYDLCKHSLSALEREITYRENQLKEIGDPDVEYRSILKQKESLMLESEDKELIQLSEDLAVLNSDIKELKEAIAAGTLVVDGLETVISLFKSAGNWGVVDLLGGGLIVTAVKHSKIDKARAAVHEVQHLLGRFERELSDLQISPGSRLGIEISSFQTFADYILDGLIFDWIVQSKIRKSLGCALDMKDNIHIILTNLQNRFKISQKKQKDAETKRQRQIEAA